MSQFPLSLNSNKTARLPNYQMNTYQGPTYYLSIDQLPQNIGHIFMLWFMRISAVSLVQATSNKFVSSPQNLDNTYVRVTAYKTNTQDDQQLFKIMTANLGRFEVRQIGKKPKYYNLHPLFLAKIIKFLLFRNCQICLLKNNQLKLAIRRQLSLKHFKNTSIQLQIFAENHAFLQLKQSAGEYVKMRHQQFKILEAYYQRKNIQFTNQHIIPMNGSIVLKAPLLFYRERSIIKHVDQLIKTENNEVSFYLCNQLLQTSIMLTAQSPEKTKQLLKRVLREDFERFQVQLIGKQHSNKLKQYVVDLSKEQILGSEYWKGDDEYQPSPLEQIFEKYQNKIQNDLSRLSIKTDQVFQNSKRKPTQESTFFHLKNVNNYQQLLRIKSALLNDEKVKNRLSQKLLKSKYISQITTCDHSILKRTDYQNFPVLDMKCPACPNFYICRTNIKDQNKGIPINCMQNSIFQPKKEVVKSICGMLNVGGGVTLLYCQITKDKILTVGQLVTQSQKTWFKDQISQQLKKVTPKASLNQNVIIQFVPIVHFQQRKEEYRINPQNKQYQTVPAQGIYQCRIKVTPLNQQKPYFYLQSNNSPLYFIFDGSTKVVVSTKQLKKIFRRKVKIHLQQSQIKKNTLIQACQTNFEHSKCHYPHYGRPIQTRFQNQHKIMLSKQKKYKQVVLIKSTQQIFQIFCKKLATKSIRYEFCKPFNHYKVKQHNQTWILYCDEPLQIIASQLREIQLKQYSQRFELDKISLLICLEDRNNGKQLTKEQMIAINSLFQSQCHKQQLKFFKHTTLNSYYIQTRSKSSTLLLYFLLTQFNEPVTFKPKQYRILQSQLFFQIRIKQNQLSFYQQLTTYSVLLETFILSLKNFALKLKQQNSYNLMLLGWYYLFNRDLVAFNEILLEKSIFSKYWVRNITRTILLSSKNVSFFGRNIIRQLLQYSLAKFHGLTQTQIENLQLQQKQSQMNAQDISDQSQQQINLSHITDQAKRQEIKNQIDFFFKNILKKVDKKQSAMVYVNEQDNEVIEYFSRKQSICYEAKSLANCLKKQGNFNELAQEIILVTELIVFIPKQMDIAEIMVKLEQENFLFQLEILFERKRFLSSSKPSFESSFRKAHSLNRQKMQKGHHLLTIRITNRLSFTYIQYQSQRLNASSLKDFIGWIISQFSAQQNHPQQYQTQQWRKYSLKSVEIFVSLLVYYGFVDPKLQGMLGSLRTQNFSNLNTLYRPSQY